MSDVRPAIVVPPAVSGLAAAARDKWRADNTLAGHVQLVLSFIAICAAFVTCE